MYQTLEIFLARKKQVPEHYNPDSNRIFHPHVDDASIGDSRQNKLHTERKRKSPPPHPREPERRNCPQPWHSRFLCNNARFLNEPVCVMATNDTDDVQNKWWPSRTSDEPLKVPKFCKSTTQRMDFKDHGPIRPIGRHSSNPNIARTQGILPVNVPKRGAEAGDVLREKISYLHGYNCRSNPNEPIRGRLHGSFVWDHVVSTGGGDQVISTPWSRRDIFKSKSLVAPKRKRSDPVSLNPITFAPVISHKIPSIPGLPPL